MRAAVWNSKGLFSSWEHRFWTCGFAGGLANKSRTFYKIIWLFVKVLWFVNLDERGEVVRLKNAVLINMANKMQLCRIIYYSIVPWLLYMFRAILSLIIRSILTVITASGFIHMYCCRGWVLAHESNRQQIINYPIQLHPVGHFYKHCIMMHGTMNVKNWRMHWYMPFLPPSLRYL